MTFTNLLWINQHEKYKRCLRVCLLFHTQKPIFVKHAKYFYLCCWAAKESCFIAVQNRFNSCGHHINTLGKIKEEQVRFVPTGEHHMSKPYYNIGYSETHSTPSDTPQRRPNIQK